MNRFVIGALLALPLALASGCSTYRIHSAEDHGALPVLKLETVRTTWAVFWAETEHQFWLCQDRGDELVCQRSCGGQTDLMCPTTVAGQGVITNTR